MNESERERYQREIDAWRHARRERLLAPDGWLSLVGLPWLEPGANSIGSAPDNAVVVATLPPHLGTVVWHANGDVEVQLAAGSGGRIGDSGQDTAILLDDGHSEPTIVHAGTTSFYLVRRGERVGLRVKDPQAPTRTHFGGLDYFPTDPAWRIQAAWQPAARGQVLEMGTVIGTIERHPVAGTAVFAREGKTFQVLPVVESDADGRHFLVFADQTSGKETYGAARFLYTEPPRDGRVVLDFNKAYNPPCAFTAFATCTMAPPENRLALRVTAGEKTYRGSAHD